MQPPDQQNTLQGTQSTWSTSKALKKALNLLLWFRVSVNMLDLASWLMPQVFQNTAASPAMLMAKLAAVLETVLS